MSIAEAAAAPTVVPPKPAVVDRSAVDASLSRIRAELSAKWVKNHRETDLHAGPGAETAKFNTLPQWSLLKVQQTRGDWMLASYDGDGATRQPGPGWVRVADVGVVGTPAVWLSTARSTALWSAPDASAKRTADLPPISRLEVLGPEPIQGDRVQVRTPGDGRRVAPGQGWVGAGDLEIARRPSDYEVPWAYPRVLQADVRLPVWYRTQLDGSSYAGANCGPTALGMVLEGFGKTIAPSTLREQVLEAEDSPWDDNAGSFIWALADVAQRYGVKQFGLYEKDGTTLRRWSLDDIRHEVKAGHPVIAQVRYRFLPGRERSDYYGDHYVVVTGLLGDSFLYNDPIGGNKEGEGPGFDRVMTGAQLTRAMNASDQPYAYTAFALSL